MRMRGAKAVVIAAVVTMLLAGGETAFLAKETKAPQASPKKSLTLPRDVQSITRKFKRFF